MNVWAYIIFRGEPCYNAIAQDIGIDCGEACQIDAKDDVSWT